MVKVSVILPTYNRARSLVPACRSVLDQSVRDLELIVVDDASQDSTHEVVERLGDSRVRYIRHEHNGGASAARNTGLEVAIGQYIAFQDSDDLWLPGKLERQINQLEGLPLSVGVVTGSKIRYGRDAAGNYGSGRVSCAPPPESRLDLEEDQVRKFLTINRISLQNALFRRECLPYSRWFDPCAKANADWEFTVRLVQHTKVFEDTEPVVLAFISEDSISRSAKKKALGLLRILKKNREVYIKYDDLYAKHMLELSRIMFKRGNYRWARRFLLGGLRRRPAAVVDILASGWRYLRSRLFGTRRAVN
ncbi:MAG: glycosyltransferase family 2 protein [Pseudomonadota bacterium]